MAQVGGELYGAMFAALLLGGIPLLVAAGIGLVIAILQAATQVQDQTLPQTAKLLAIALVLLVFGGLLALPLRIQTERIFNELPTIAGRGR
jgi:type III secretion protein S